MFSGVPLVIKKAAFFAPTATAVLVVACRERKNPTAPADSIEMTSLQASASSKLKSVTVTPSSASIQSGTTTQLSAASKPPGATFVWASSNQAVATVSQTGLVTGVTAGTATITASAGGQTGRSLNTVHAAPPPGDVAF